MTESSSDVDQEIMDLIKKAKARRKRLAAGSSEEKILEENVTKPKEQIVKPKEQEHEGYRSRYLERRKKQSSTPIETEVHKTEEYIPPKIPEKMVPEEYTPSELPEEIEQELGLPEKEQTLSLAEQLEALEKPSASACKFCGALNTKKYYCPYCGTQFCTSCAKMLGKEGDKTVYECPKCKKEVYVKED